MVIGGFSEIGGWVDVDGNDKVKLISLDPSNNPVPDRLKNLARFPRRTFNKGTFNVPFAGILALEYIFITLCGSISCQYQPEGQNSGIMIS